MIYRWIVAGTAATLALTGCTIKKEGDDASQNQGVSGSMSEGEPKISTDHEALLTSPDPKLAANKRLVYDMYRIVLQAGRADRAGDYIATGYIQHNPNAGQGLAGLIDYVKATRPERPIQDKLDLPLIHLMAEGDYVTTAFVRPEKDAEGKTYYSTWFDLYRIEDGKIAEHWDPMLKTDAKIDPNEKKL